MKIDCIIIDDEPLAVDLIEGYINRIPFLALQGKFYSAMEAMEYFQTHTVPLVFLDINMPQINGIEFAGILPQSTRFIFTTAYAEYAIESYEKHAFDYLLKPITFERFLKSATRFREYFNSHANQETEAEPIALFVKSGKKIIQLELKDVSHIEGMKDYARFHHGREHVLINRTMKDLEQQLPEYFQRVHHSFFVNLKWISKIEDNHIHLNDKSAVIPISSKYREAFLERIKFWFQ